MFHAESKADPGNWSKARPSNLLSMPWSICTEAQEFKNPGPKSPSRPHTKFVETATEVTTKAEKLHVRASSTLESGKRNCPEQLVHVWRLPNYPLSGVNILVQQLEWCCGTVHSFETWIVDPLLFSSECRKHVQQATFELPRRQNLRVLHLGNHQTILCLFFTEK